MKNKNLLHKIILLIGLIVAVTFFYLFHLDRFLTLSYLKQYQNQLSFFYSNHTVLTTLIYMTIYIMVTSLSLPGAALLTLAGGALFGFWMGTVVVSFASTIGATLACIVSRFLLREWVQNKFKDKLSSINEGIKKEGVFYLFTLRLIPVFPFFVINLLMGLTPMPLFQFYWVSQLGMLAGTMVYVNAGKELARIDSLSGILSARLIFSFILLGVFPIIVKKVIAGYKKYIQNKNQF
ncbi:MAG: TVP38/TMEM64 family protein [Deltaproteobacteria bacterium]|nr:TVP38/TMEM64 family protein [Deltaproteobacteria bacterium]MBW1719206.1 TVP38/TMEM64 family protein [Deltaproteobacteria bacterium]MBW1938785.1 TVP38/TMEM64 family protein [Deltaproteobacteria bacterium]MBW1964243.1 TVP38/TMEM64 family protein [Deltaproteobacteria bacterium]MBW2080110.1 TVP38/TMEM64 family protein [Deltaproteobacteria bacterium]